MKRSSTSSTRTKNTARLLLAGLFVGTGFLLSIGTDASAKLAKRTRSNPPPIEQYAQDWEDEVDDKKRRGDDQKDWREPSSSDSPSRDQVPEIDPGTARGAATLLLGGLTLLRYRRKH